MSDKKKSALLKRAEFRAWLEAKGDRIVGITVKETSCPLARFLRQEKGLKNAWVGLNAFRPDGYTGELRRLPKWAALFIGRIDDLGNGLSETKVTGADAKTVLDGIK